MARLPYIEEPTDEVKPIYDDLEKQVGSVLNPIKMIAHSPQLLNDWWKMMMTLILDLELSNRIREVALLRIFKLTGCEYCFNEHNRIARDVGVSARQIAEINDYETSDAFDEQERLVLRYTDGITKDNTVDDALFEALREHFTDRQLVELTFCIGNWIGISKFIVSMGLELEAPRTTHG